jgi:hypothetical protein
MAKFDEEAYKKRIAREIAEEEAREMAANDRAVDDSLMFETFELLGMRASEVAAYQAAAEEAIKDTINVDDAMRAIKKGKKEYRKGNKAKAAKILGGNKNVAKLRKAAKKKKGCAVVALLMLTIGGGTFGSLVWGAVEVVSALAR